MKQYILTGRAYDKRAKITAYKFIDKHSYEHIFITLENLTDFFSAYETLNCSYNYYNGVQLNDRRLKLKNFPRVDFDSWSLLEDPIKFYDEANIISVATKREAERVRYAIGEVICSKDLKEANGATACKYANMYYDTVRSMTNDISQIHLSTGYSIHYLKQAKEYLFLNKHDLERGRPARFDADLEVARIWQRLLTGDKNKLRDSDLKLLQHIMYEADLVRKGMDLYEAHVIAKRATEAGPW